MIISQVGPAKDEEAAGEEEETLEQWRLAKMERMTGRGEAMNADSVIVCTTSRNEILVVSVWPW